MWSDKIYSLAPIALQNVMASVQGWKIHRIRYGCSAHWQANQILERNEKYSLDILREKQFQQFLTFLNHCYRFSPYYRRKFKKIGLRPEDIQRPDDICHIPITPKEDFRANTNDFFTHKIRHGMIAVHTSGTTGSPLTVYFSRRDIAWRFSFLERCRRWAGVRIGQRRASFTGQMIIPARQVKPPFWRFNRPGNQLLFSSYHLAPENLPAYVEALERFQPEIVDGYPSSIHILSQQIEQDGKIGMINPRAILVSAETVFPHQRAVIERAFQCKIYNQYASSEGAPFVSECREGRLHVHLDSGLIEVLRPDGSSVQVGEGGQMVVTSFDTHITPLLRYAIGDMAIPAHESSQCPCGLPFPFVEALVGRVDDVLYSPDRGYVGRLDTVFKELPNSIIEAQIIQRSPDRISLRLVPDKKRFTPEHVNMILGEMRKRLGSMVAISVEEVPFIPRMANGKMRPVINLCEKYLPEALRYSNFLDAGKAAL